MAFESPTINTQNWKEITDNVQEIFNVCHEISKYIESEIQSNQSDTVNHSLPTDAEWKNWFISNLMVISTLINKIPFPDPSKVIKSTFIDKINMKTEVLKLYEFLSFLYFSINEPSHPNTDYAILTRGALESLKATFEKCKNTHQTGSSNGQNDELNEHINEILRILSQFITNKREINTHLEYLNTEARETWIPNLTKNVNIIKTFHEVFFHRLSTLERNVIQFFFNFFEDLKYFPSNRYNVYYISAIKHHILASNILEAGKTYQSQKWENILQNTKQIYDTVHEIATLTKQDVKLNSITPTDEVLIVNWKWNRTLRENIDIIKEIAKRGNSLGVNYSETISFLEKLSDFTHYTIDDDEDYANLSVQSLQLIKIELEKLKDPSKKDLKQNFLNGYSMLESPWPAIERLAAIIESMHILKATSRPPNVSSHEVYSPQPAAADIGLRRRAL